MERYTIYCTKEQALRAYKLGAPLKEEKPYAQIVAVGETKGEFGQRVGIYFCIPTAEQMCGWLREKGVCIEITANEDCTGRWASALCVKGENASDKDWWYDFSTQDYYASYNEAMSAAIDKAIDYLEKKGGEV